MKLCGVYRKPRGRRISPEIVLCEPGRKSGRIPEKREKCYFLFSCVSNALLPELLTTDCDTYRIYVQSPFPKRKPQDSYRQRCKQPRYTRRNRAEYRKIARYIARCVWQRPGNYMVFFRRIVLWRTYCRFMRKNFP